MWVNCKSGNNNINVNTWAETPATSSLEMETEEWTLMDSRNESEQQICLKPSQSSEQLQFQYVKYAYPSTMTLQEERERMRGEE